MYERRTKDRVKAKIIRAKITGYEHDSEINYCQKERERDRERRGGCSTSDRLFCASTGYLIPQLLGSIPIPTQIVRPGDKSSAHVLEQRHQQRGQVSAVHLTGI